MTELPFADSTFDFVYATESLEHAVEIERAVSEMCRVLKPGGKLVIIDKNVEHWGRFGTPAWERWFSREELEGLLAQHCRKRSQRVYLILGGCGAGRAVSLLGLRKNSCAEHHLPGEGSGQKLRP